MAALKPAYLIHGDDHGAVAERRAGLRALAEGGEGDAASVELLEGDAGTPAGVAQALATMTLAIGRRVIIVEGVERWRDADVEKHLLPAMREIPPETTLALFAREEPRAKAAAPVHEAVKRAGGQVVAQMTVKPWELPKWAREQAARIGLSLDGAAAKALVAQVGERQQRLLRELEKLALEDESPDKGAVSDPSARAAGSSAMRQVTLADIESRAAHSAEWRAYGLADALVGGDRREAALSYLRLRHQGERLSGLTYLMAQRLRDALAAALRLRSGESVAEVKRGIRMPPRAADRFLADVAHTDPEKLREALAALADLEVDSRGGAVLSIGRSPLAGMSEDTLALRAIEEMTR
ncbi:MAG: polymerase delta subunit [Solirubrobacterales bacterium]|nr:polymerase delta subunit [Solirubrobacterales bacterium]